MDDSLVAELEAQLERLTAAFDAATRRLTAPPVTVGPPAGEAATQAQREPLRGQYFAADDRLFLVHALFGENAHIARVNDQLFNVYQRGLYRGQVEATPNGELVWVA